MKNQKNYTKHKGFTLVELIVVIVILAILAAILIPGLLKWIDQAKKKQYELEARNIYLATEASIIELHTRGFTGTNGGKPWNQNNVSGGCNLTPSATGGTASNAVWLAYIKERSGMETISYMRCYTDKGKVKALAIKYTSSDGKTILATIKEKGYNPAPAGLPLASQGSWEWSDDGAWNIEVVPEP